MPSTRVTSHGISLLRRTAWFSALLTLALLVAPVMAFAPLPILFTVAFTIAVNHPGLQAQRSGEAHAQNVLSVWR
ncbi:hypothetical protein [Sinorhizobium medicae]|uniref:hypothetical protein n=1 Tax=Sinorhizobium medicae TaxID=110321 RepID=UPI001296CDB1|nr:hypothetical protein [Sinorhizobium medicae]MQX79061.1 hypothetical protein [Sinorhizobium medicae]